MCVSSADTSIAASLNQSVRAQAQATKSIAANDTGTDGTKTKRPSEPGKGATLDVSA